MVGAVDIHRPMSREDYMPSARSGGNIKLIHPLPYEL